MEQVTTLILSDMDGTLLNTKQEISKQNKQAIHKLISANGLFGIATGRSWQNIKFFYKDLKPNAPCILCNGSILFDPIKEEIIECKCMDDESLFRLVSYIKKEFPSVIIMANTSTEAWVISDKETVQDKYIHAFGPYRFGDIDQVRGKCVKLFCYDKGLECYQRLSDADMKGMTEHLEMVCTGMNYMEFMPGQVSKGCMLDSLKKYLKNNERSVSKVYAIGDYENDIELLRKADVGIAPLNALEETKKAADYISVSNNHHVVAELINTLLNSQQCLN